MTTNQVAYWNLQEMKRSNAAREFETNRANVAKEQELNRSNLAREELDRFRNEAQAKRWKIQNGVDITNAVTGGIKNMTPSMTWLAGLFI